MTSTKNLISVIIPTRNRPDLLRRAIASVVEQDYRPIELIVIDNVSDVPVVVESSDLMCRIHRNEKMLNLPTNRNLGVTLSSGEMVCFLDDDDYYLPGKLSVLAKHLDGFDLCYCNTRMIGPGGRDLGVMRGEGNIGMLMLYRYIHPNSTLMRRAMFDNVLFDENMTTYEDVDFIFRAFRKYRIRHVDEVGAVWNRDDRPDQMTARNLPRAYRNWLILCEKFSNEIDQYREVARFYYRKMFLLSITQRQPANALRYLWKFLLRGVVKFKPS